MILLLVVRDRGGGGDWRVRRRQDLKKKVRNVWYLYREYDFTLYFGGGTGLCYSALTVSCLCANQPNQSRRSVGRVDNGDTRRAAHSRKDGRGTRKELVPPALCFWTNEDVTKVALRQTPHHPAWLRVKMCIFHLLLFQPRWLVPFFLA